MQVSCSAAEEYSRLLDDDGHQDKLPAGPPASSSPWVLSASSKLLCCCCALCIECSLPTLVESAGQQVQQRPPSCMPIWLNNYSFKQQAASWPADSAWEAELAACRQPAGTWFRLLSACSWLPCCSAACAAPQSNALMATGQR